MSRKPAADAEPQYDEFGNAIEPSSKPKKILAPDPLLARLAAVEAVLEWAWPGELGKVTDKLAAEAAASEKE